MEPEACGVLLQVDSRQHLVFFLLGSARLAIDARSDFASELVETFVVLRQTTDSDES